MSLNFSIFAEAECSRSKIERDSQQSPAKSVTSTTSPEPPTTLKKHSPPNVTVIHPSANHPMFSYLCHATGNMAAVAAGYMSQPNYPTALLPPTMDFNPNAAAASLMNPFLFNQILRQGFPHVGIEGNTGLSPNGTLHRPPVSLSHRFSPYSLSNTSSTIPSVSAASLLSRNPVVAAGDDLKNLLSTLSRIKGEV